MPQDRDAIRFVEGVLSLTDFTRASERAFEHALAIALQREAWLAILHAGRHQKGNWRRFPGVRQTLDRWGLLEPGSPRSAVLDQLRVQIEKVEGQGDPVGIAHDFVQREGPDLVVLATEGREGVARFLRPSKAERIVQRTRSMTLFVPADGRGLVSSETGEVSLRRILVPLDFEPDPTEALIRATRAAEAMGREPVEIVLLHAGDDTFPNVERPASDAWTWCQLQPEGDPVDAILAEAENADLIVMATAGHQGLLDVLRGSVTERVLRSATCPMLAIPAS